MASFLTEQNERAIRAIAEATADVPGAPASVEARADDLRLMVIMDKANGPFPCLGDPGYIPHMRSIGKDVLGALRNLHVDPRVVDPAYEEARQ